MLKTVKTTALVAMVSLALFFSGVAQAGRSCDATKPPPSQVIEKGMTLAERTMHMLDAEYAKNGTKVVVLARAGQDLSKYKLRYSHLGLAYKNTDGQ